METSGGLEDNADKTTCITLDCRGDMDQVLLFIRYIHRAIVSRTAVDVTDVMSWVQRTNEDYLPVNT